MNISKRSNSFLSPFRMRRAKLEYKLDHRKNLLEVTLSLTRTAGQRKSPNCLNNWILELGSFREGQERETV